VRNRIARRRQLLDIAEDGGFERIVVWNGAVGFFAGAYQIYAFSLTLPIIKLVYWYPDNISKSNETLLRTSTLLGTIVGQLVSGFLADIYGRRRVYGYELYVILVAICGVSMSSRGVAYSMDIFGWLFAWRFIMGIGMLASTYLVNEMLTLPGVGADYPLSATLTAEFASSKYRARMLGFVFYAQPIGYLCATLMTLACVSHYSDDIPHDLNVRTCDHTCRAALDRVWRSIIAIGIIPTLLAVYFRRTIPESTWYTADILNRADEAVDDIIALKGGLENVKAEHRQPNYELLPSGEPDSTQAAGTSPRLGASTTRFRDTNGRTVGTIDESRAHAPGEREQSPRGNIRRMSNGRRLSKINTGAILQPSVSQEEAQSFKYRWTQYWKSFHKHFITQGNWPKLLGVSMAWLTLDCSYYALLGSSASTISSKIFHQLPIELDCTYTGNLTRDTWPPAYDIAPNCSRIDNSNKENPQAVGWYYGLMALSWHILILMGIGSVLGGAAMIWWTKKHSPRLTQLFSFLSIALLFVIAGVVLVKVPGDNVTAPSIFLYIMAQGLFEFGPNFTTFTLPVELFPTQHRAFSHGIAAATGKVGACMFQIFVQYSAFGSHTVDEAGTVWLGYSLLCFIPVMLLGAAVTFLFIPETRINAEKKGRDVPLEDLEDLEIPKAGQRLLGLFGYKTKSEFEHWTTGDMKLSPSPSPLFPPGAAVGATSSAISTAGSHRSVPVPLVEHLAESKDIGAISSSSRPASGIGPSETLHPDARLQSGAVSSRRPIPPSKSADDEITPLKKVTDESV
jgi:PHS family inorganic phosphate transporter-like MFS transporter